MFEHSLYLFLAMLFALVVFVPKTLNTIFIILPILLTWKNYFQGESLTFSLLPLLFIPMLVKIKNKLNMLHFFFVSMIYFTSSFDELILSTMFYTMIRFKNIEDSKAFSVLSLCVFMILGNVVGLFSDKAALVLVLVYMYIFVSLSSLITPNKDKARELDIVFATLILVKFSFTLQVMGSVDSFPVASLYYLPLCLVMFHKNKSMSESTSLYIVSLFAIFLSGKIEFSLFALLVFASNIGGQLNLNLMGILYKVMLEIAIFCCWLWIIKNSIDLKTWELAVVIAVSFLHLKMLITSFANSRDYFFEKVQS